MLLLLMLLGLLLMFERDGFWGGGGPFLGTGTLRGATLTTVGSWSVRGEAGEEEEEEPKDEAGDGGTEPEGASWSEKVFLVVEGS